MREIEPILGVILIGTLWGITGRWEWKVPQCVEQKIIQWKRKWCYIPMIIRVTCTDPIEELEMFTWSLKSSLPELQRELGFPVRLEVEWKEPECAAALAGSGSVSHEDGFQKIEKDTEENSEENQEISQRFSCLSRRFPEIFWIRQAEYE